MIYLEYPLWQAHVLDALLESQPEELHEKMEAAKRAIFRRFQELSYQVNSSKERLALNDALRILRSFQIRNS